ncbi:MFS transporter, partial [Citrobacter freundii]
QSVGYLLAACGPPLMGKIHDLNGSWLIPLTGVAVLAMLMAVFGLCAGRNREIASA